MLVEEGVTESDGLEIQHFSRRMDVIEIRNIDTGGPGS